MLMKIDLINHLGGSFFVQDFSIFAEEHWVSLSEDMVSVYNYWSANSKPPWLLAEAKAFGGHKMNQNVWIFHTPTELFPGCQKPFILNGCGHKDVQKYCFFYLPSAFVAEGFRSWINSVASHPMAFISNRFQLRAAKKTAWRMWG